MAPKKKKGRKKKQSQFYTKSQKASLVIPLKAKKKHSKKLYVTFASIVCLCIIIVSVFVVLNEQETTVSSSVMDKYAKTLVSDYNKDINFFLPTNSSYFPFYSNNSYTIKAIISSNYGTALVMSPAETWSFNNVATTQRIEKAVFGPNNFNFATQIGFNGNGVGFSSFGNNQTRINGIGFTVYSNSSVIFRNVNIGLNGNIGGDYYHYYFFLIVKGNNNTKSWNNEAALNDAKLLFDDDLYFALNNSEAVREYYAYPQLAPLITNALVKWHDQLLVNSSVSYSPAQFAYDIQQIEELAKTKYGITNNAFVNDTLNYLESVTLPTPTLTQTRTILGINDSNNWIYATLCALFPNIIYGLFLIFEEINKKLSLKGLKFMTSTVILEIVLGAIIGEQLLVHYSFKSPLSLLQIVFIIGIWIFGFFIFYSIEKKLPLRVNDANATKTEANDKTKTAPPTQKI